jgi:NADPH-dependent curcumin reductase CurA
VVAALRNATSLPDDSDRLSVLMRAVLTKRLTVKGFILFKDYADRYGEVANDMTAWLANGEIQYLEQIVDEL